MTTEEFIGEAQPLKEKRPPTKMSIGQFKTYLLADMNPRDEEVYNKIKEAYLEDKGVIIENLSGFCNKANGQTQRSLTKLNDFGLIYFDRVQRRWWLRELKFNEEYQDCKGCDEYVEGKCKYQEFQKITHQKLSCKRDKQ